MAKRTHLMSKTTEYEIWRGMLKRCYNEKHEKYHLYGGRGITVCDEWKTFEGFFADMGYRPSKRHSLDRKERDKGYSKDNCRWATIEEQNSNRSNTVFLEHAGEKLTAPQWAEKLNISLTVIRRRLQYGWSVEKTLTTPVRRYKVG